MDQRNHRAVYPHAPRLTVPLLRICQRLPKEDRIELVRALQDVPPLVVEDMPDAEIRFAQLAAAMQHVTGYSIAGRSRVHPLPWCRAIIAWTMGKEGYSQMQIADCLERNHSSVSIATQRVRDAFLYPNQYPELIRIYNDFIKYIYDYGKDTER